MNATLLSAFASTAPQRHGRTGAAPALKPLVLAILAAFPLYSAGQTAVLRPPAPAVSAVPKAMPGWRVSGTGAAAPLNSLPNSKGGIDQSITQTSQRGIYNWQSFDIGASSSVTFNFPGSDSSALNRVTGSTAPSQIFGTLRSQYTNPDPGKAPLVGGSVYLYNANGILFGRNAQVNVGSLIASTLNLADNDFLSGLTSAIGSSDPAFKSESLLPALFTDERNFVVVDPGASITTASGGRVFLFAKNVQNGGTITAPEGQVALAAGGSVYLQKPDAEVLYASEVNPQFPSTRGLLVEVGAGSGSASNLASGTIETARGSTTLVAMAVNQLGRIAATTSVTQNGSVFLLARGDTPGGVSVGVGDLKTQHATVSGMLTLGAGSQIDIAPDTTLGADGKPATADGNSSFTTSRVELAGKTIEIQSGAQIVAHGGIVNARAEAKPNYQNTTTKRDYYAAFDGNDATRIVIAQNAVIDVSGTTTTEVSTARNFVTTQLIGKADLKDAPLQKDGPLYRSKVTFDLRNPVAILGDTSSYQAAIGRTVDERLAKGGSVLLASTGALVTSPSSVLKVSGGQVTYTDANVVETRLIAADGTRYTLDKAPKDIVYTGIEGASKVTQDRWGIVPQWLPSQARTGRLEKGYVDGQAGGTLTIAAPHSIVDGRIEAGTTAGARQTGGQDASAPAAAVVLGFRSNLSDSIQLGNSLFVTAGVRDLTVTSDALALPASFWADPLGRAVPQASRIAAATIDASGAGKLVVSADGNVVIEPGADIALPQNAALDIAAGGAAGISLGADFRAEGGSVLARTLDVGNKAAGGITLQPGVSIDVSGRWVNRALDGETAAAASAGGSVTLRSNRSLVLEDASRIDVSGGATVATNGTVAGTAAGSIGLQANAKRIDGQIAPRIHLGADLVAQSLGGGGTLAVSGMDAVTIASQPIPRGVKDGAAAGSLQFSPQFFTQGAFSNYDIQAGSKLQVLAGVTIAPQTSNWILTADAAQAPTGSKVSSFLEQGVLPDAQRKPASLSLSASTPSGTLPAGDLTLAAGAQIVTDPLASVSLKAELNLDVEGRVRAPGGKISLTTAEAADVGKVEEAVKGSFIVGSSAMIDASGVAVRKLQTGLLPQGSVLDGGSVSFAVAGKVARLTPLQIMPGAVIAADGASDRLGVTTVGATGATTIGEQAVVSNGGSISISAQEGGAVLAGDLHALAGGEGASAGSFSLKLGGFRDTVFNDFINLIDSYAIVVQQAPLTQVVSVPGSVQVSAERLGAGFANASLQSLDRIRFNGDVDWHMAGNITLDAPLITAAPQSRNIALTAGGSLLMGNTPARTFPTATTPIAGSAALALQAGLVEFYGTQGLQGFQRVDAKASSEIRLAGIGPGNKQTGKLSLQADLTLSAPQVSATSASDFTIDAAGQRVLITGGDNTASAPLSAGSAITVNAREITTRDAADASRYGVLRAPFGQITLNASDRIDIDSGSVVSVSGEGATVLYGSTVNNASWVYNKKAVDAPLAKTVTLKSSSVNLAAGSTLDASGGGHVLATEFIAGPGGSTDVFAGAAGGAFAVVPGIKGFAPQDTDTLTQLDKTGAGASAQLGRQITVGAGGPMAAGTYTVLPARYALLDGAYLVRPVASGTPLALGAAIAKQDGSVLVGGQLGNAGTGPSSSLTQSFQVFSSTLARTFSEVRLRDADTYFATRAAAADLPAPRLPQDAGRIDIAAQQLALKGTAKFDLPAGSAALGGELDISANRIRIGTDGSASQGVLALNAADLNATGAALLVIGGSRSADGSQLSAAASEVTLDNAGVALKGADVVLVATDRIELKTGAAIDATAAPATPAAAATSSSPSAPAPAPALSGDGALLRVSADAAAASVRTDAQRQRGDLVLGSATSLKGGALTAEATRSTTFASDATIAATAITVGASRIAIGDIDKSKLAPTTLALTPALAAQLGSGQALTLRSFDGIDFVGNAVLGGAALQSLTLDSGALRVAAGGAASGNAKVEAGGIALVNSTGAGTESANGNGQLALRATGAAGGSGQVVIGPGSISVVGAAALTLDAANEVLVRGESQLTASGDVAIRASALQAAQAAQASLSARGSLTLDANGAALRADPGVGAHLSIEAASIVQNGRIVLPSGELSLAASQRDVRIANGASIDLAGRSKTFDGVVVGTSGGSLRAAAASGNVTIATGALLDVSAASAAGSGGSAGSVALAATAGSVTIGGSLRGSSAADQGGASLSVDSAAPLDLGALAATLAASPGNFSESIAVRNRSGDQKLSAGGSGLAAHRIAISADSGSLEIAGALDASGVSGPAITLAAGNVLTIGSGAQLSAHSTGQVGGEVQLLAGRPVQAADGSFVPNGAVLLNGGRIDTSAASGSIGGSDGALLIRAQRNAAGTEVNVAGAGGTTLIGASRVELEAVKHYQAEAVEGETTAAIDAALITAINSGTQTLAGSNGANASAVRNRVGKLFTAPQSVQLRAGIEVDQADASIDLLAQGVDANNGWNLTRFDALGKALAQPTGAPVNLTLRAAGNLVVPASISDGFMPAGTLPTSNAAASKITPTAVVAKVDGAYLDGARIRLVGGADLGAADVMATTASATAGDVTIGSGGSETDVIVRSTTGAIQIAAGRDVTLTDHQAVVYTTGKPIAGAGYVGLVSPTLNLLSGGGTAQSPTLSGGGSVSVQAARDVAGAGAVDGGGQYGSEWLWRGVDVKGQPAWWVRYDRFQQGFATFGGGNVAVGAGHDATNVEASAASNGYIGAAGAGLNRQGGGDVALTAGRDVSGGFVLGDGAALTVRSGRNVVGPADGQPGALQVLHGDTQVNVDARNAANVGLVTAFGSITAAAQAFAGVDDITLIGVAPLASLRMVAEGGDLLYGSLATTDSGFSTAKDHATSSGADNVIPSTALFAAANGNATISEPYQVPSSTSSLNLVAQGQVSASSLRTRGIDARQASPTLLRGSAAAQFITSPFGFGQQALTTGSRTPTRIVATDGDVTVSTTESTQALRLLAGRDVIVTGQVVTQHQAAEESSLIQAGRDIIFAVSDQPNLTFKLQGPGDLIAIAGRNVDLGTSGGFGTLGNRENAALPAQSAKLTVLAGVSLGRGDYTAATASYFELLGGRGVAGYAADLAAQLAAVKAGQPVPAVGSAAAATFKAASVAEQVAQTQSLVGATAFDAAVLRDAQRRAEPGKTIDLATAKKNFDALPDADKSKLLGTALASAWALQVPRAQQRETALALAAAQGNAKANAAALVAFVAAQTGQAGRDLPQSLAAFEQLAPERQLVFTNQVLFGEIRSAGRVASSLAGAERDAAYAKAYDALAVVFPEAGGSGSLNMGSSQLRTSQGSEIDVLTPRGGVNVGELASSGSRKSASELGIVTGAGGGISIAVRDNVDVNQSRVFTVGQGDLLIWSSQGNIDAGRGAKTVTGAPPPVFRIDSTGNFVIDTSGSYSGSGIAVLDASSTLDLYAPAGEINAGDAGIKSLGNAFLGAARFVGADNLSVSGVAVGAPPPASTGGDTAGLASVGQAAVSAGTRINAEDSEEEKERKRRKRLNLVLDFLGFGDGAARP